MTDQAGRVQDACATCFEAEKHDCGGFVRAVAARLGLTLVGCADEIVGNLRDGADWTRLPDGVAAAQAAATGKLVVAGLTGREQIPPDDRHGHVVVVVEGPLARGAYPTAFWGSLGGDPGLGKSLDWAWCAGDRDRITYAARELPRDQ